MLNYFIIAIIPIIIMIIIICGIYEKKDVLKLFIEGVEEGLKTILKIFPYIMAITISIGLFKDTGAIKIFISPLKSILNKFLIPDNIVPLFLLRPLSGGASMSIVSEIFKESGPDSISGKMASIIMGATETTIYTITILFGAIGIKKTRGVLIAGIIADIVAILTTIILVNLNIL